MNRSGERKTNRNWWRIDALFATLEAGLGQRGLQKTGESLEVFIATNKLQRRRDERRTASPGSIRVSRLSRITTSICLESVTWLDGAALLDEHSTFVKVKRALVRAFTQAHLYENRDTDATTRRPRPDSSGLSPPFHASRRSSGTVTVGLDWLETESLDPEGGSAVSGT